MPGLLTRNFLINRHQAAAPVYLPATVCPVPCLSLSAESTTRCAHILVLAAAEKSQIFVLLKLLQRILCLAGKNRHVMLVFALFAR